MIFHATGSTCTMYVLRTCSSMRTCSTYSVAECVSCVCPGPCLKIYNMYVEYLVPLPLPSLAVSQRVPVRWQLISSTPSSHSSSSTTTSFPSVSSSPSRSVPHYKTLCQLANYKTFVNLQIFPERVFVVMQ